MDDAQGQLDGFIDKFTPEALDDPRVEALIAEALATTEWPIDPNEPQRLIIKSPASTRSSGRATAKTSPLSQTGPTTSATIRSPFGATASMPCQAS